MKHSFKAGLIILCLAVLILPGLAKAQFLETGANASILNEVPKVQAVMFWMESCGLCHHIIDTVLPPLQEKYGDQLEIALIELKTREDVDMLYHLAEHYDIEPGMVGVPFLIVGESALIGSQEIPQKLPGLIDRYLNAGGVDYPAQIDLTSAVMPEPSPREDNPANNPSGSSRTVNVYFFWGDGCPYCEAQKPFLAELSSLYPEVKIHSFEVWYVEKNRQIFFDMANAAGFEPTGVPVTFIGDQVWTGFHTSLKPEMEAAVLACITSACTDMGRGIAGIVLEPEEPQDPVVEQDPVLEPAPSPVDDIDSNLITIPILGSINLNAYSLGFSTAIIAFVDGFNPCSLWVLSILLALVIHSGSRRKTLVVGLTFLLVTAGVYGLFIAGLFKVFTVVSYIGWIQAVVALLALGFALINIKDYFWYKEGVSLTISDKHKPKIYRNFRSVLAGDKSIFALIGATIVMALGIALVELPCTAGFPVLWSKLVSAQQVTTLSFFMLLGLYLLIYLLDELLIFGTAVVTLKASKLEEKQGRVLKLIGGVVMLALAFVLLFNPDLMNNFGNSLLVFGGAFGATLIVLLLHRVILPHFGIVIGTEDVSKKTPKSKSQATGD
jgi:thiol-disulfide isomerase/thioredoxin